MVRGEPGVPQTIGQGQSPQHAAGHAVACKGGVVVAVDHHVGVQRSTFFHGATPPSHEVDPLVTMLQEKKMSFVKKKRKKFMPIFGV